MSEYYSPGQLSVIYPYLVAEPRWFLLGGPADANEAQTAVRQWPFVKVVGVEPNREAWRWQLENGWPRGEPLVNAALSAAPGKVKIQCPRGHVRSASTAEDRMELADPADVREVAAVTWDTLDRTYGPFEEAVMWMDVEGSELDALLGAVEVFRRGAVRLVNVEMESRRRQKNEDVVRFMDAHGFRAVKDWNDSETCRDRVFVRDR